MAWIELPMIGMLGFGEPPPIDRHPASALWAIVFPAPAAVPPTVVPAARGEG